jgi:hypothetical protein
MHNILQAPTPFHAAVIRHTGHSSVHTHTHTIADYEQSKMIWTEVYDSNIMRSNGNYMYHLL